jgi:hypothetical protein
MVPRAESEDVCADGICASAPPSIVGQTLTGCGLTLAQAAEALDRGDAIALTAVQRRMVERWVLERGL